VVNRATGSGRDRRTRPQTTGGLDPWASRCQFQRVRSEPSPTTTARRRLSLAYWAASPVSAILVPTAFVGVMFGSGAVNLANPPLSNLSLVYCFGGIIGNLLFALMGMRLGAGRSRRFQSRTSVFREPWPKGPGSVNTGRLRLLQLLALVGLGFNVLAIVLSYGGGIDFSDLESVRMGSREDVLLSYPGDMLSPFCLIVMAVSILKYEDLAKWTDTQVWRWA